MWLEWAQMEPKVPTNANHIPFKIHALNVHFINPQMHGNKDSPSLIGNMKPSHSLACHALTKLTNAYCYTPHEFLFNKLQRLPDLERVDSSIP